MEVRTPGNRSLSLGTVISYAGVAATVGGCLFLPAVFIPTYGIVLRTVLLLVGFGLAARALLSAFLAARTPAAPPIAPDAELPTVSIIVTAYNEAAVLPQTITACQELDYPDEKLEIILSYEAASTDDTARIAETAAADPTIRAVRRDAPPGGKGSATNHAIQHATGELFAIIDADQRFEPRAVRRAVSWFLSDSNVWCIKGRCFGTNPRDSLVTLHATVERHLAERGDFFAREVLSGFTLFTGGQVFVRAELFDVLDPFDETVLLEDLEMTARMHANGMRIRVDPGIVTTENNPAAFSPWWNQRKRWARGGMQVAHRHLIDLLLNTNLGTRVRLDVLYTFGYLLFLPLILLVTPPFFLYDFVFSEGTSVLWQKGVLAFLGLSSVLSVAFIFAQDSREQRSHARREYAAVLTLPAYVTVESIAIIVAFIDEFIFRRPTVYVTSSRPDDESFRT